MNITSKKERVGLYEVEDCVTRIWLSEEIDLLGLKQKIEKNISKDELKEIFNVLLEEKGYKVNDIIYNDGLESYYEGYYMSEREVKRAYFRGIILNVSEIKNMPKTKTHKL